MRSELQTFGVGAIAVDAKVADAHHVFTCCFICNSVSKKTPRSRTDSDDSTEVWEMCCILAFLFLILSAYWLRYSLLFVF